MSKKYKGKICVYCAVEASTSADHVFAREFFLLDRRANLPKVPACGGCNGSKSDLERYLTAVLPFGGDHPDSSTILQAEVPRRLARNPKLHRALADGMQPVQLREGDDTDLRKGLPLEPEKLIELFEFIPRGLAFYHWGVVIPPDHMVKASVINPVYEHILEDLFRLDGGAYARGGPGNNSFRYEGRQAVDHPALTIWRFQVYGGLQLVGDEEVPHAVASNIWACSTPPSVTNLLLEPN